MSSEPKPAEIATLILAELIDAARTNKHCAFSEEQRDYIEQALSDAAQEAINRMRSAAAVPSSRAQAKPIRAHLPGCRKSLSVPVDLCSCGGRDFIPDPDFISALPPSSPVADLEVIVNGQPVTVAAGTVRAVIEEAIRRSGQIGAPVAQWQLRTTEGDIIPHNLTDGTDYELTPGRRLWLNLGPPSSPVADTKALMHAITMASGVGGVTPEQQRASWREVARIALELAGVAPVADSAQPCVIGEYCKLHGFIHGAEAEELRERIETLITQSGRRVYADDIQQILDDVDARDSCAVVESAPSASAAADDRKDP